MSNFLKMTSSEMSRVFFISDTHWGHRKIIEYCNRPFSSAEEMDEKMIENWNKKVKKADKVIHLGDVMFAKNFDPSLILERLNGEIILCRGNHDVVEQLLPSKKITMVRDILNIQVNFQNIVCCHFPMKSWERKEDGSFMIFGHVHDSYQSPDDELSYNVGVEWTNYSPLSFEELSDIMKIKKEKWLAKKEERNDSE